MLHTTGNKYKTKDGLIGLLSTFMMGDKSYCMLISIGDSTTPDYKGYNGNRYKDPIQTESPYNLSEDEITKLAGEGWELYTDIVSI